MRITNKMITTKYIRSINTLSTDLNKLNTQVASGRAFSKSSENTSAAVKAYQIRRDLSKTKGYQANIAHAQSSLTNTESALNHINELVQNAKVKVMTGKTGTASADERSIIATEIRSIQDQLLHTLNSNASGGYYFGGTNTDTPPFTLDANGKLTYNGYTLERPLPAGTDAENKALIGQLKKDSMYVDIGLGANIIADPLDPSKTIVDTGSVFQYSISGINIVGSGTSTVNGKTVSNNLYDLLGEIATQFESGDDVYETVDALYGKLHSASMEVVYNLTNVGSKTSYLDFMTDRYETQTLDLQERQLSVEGADAASTIIKFKSQELAYNAALQMGTKIIQPSIFDFMS
ncbi:MAG: flagellar hook-associated protein FlgL [Eubacteriales bacterium]|nr:flagellar hook-associated protein FlgL [Eubacteriales bacterium]